MAQYTNIEVTGEVEMSGGSEVDLSLPQAINTVAVGEVLTLILTATPLQIAVPTGAQTVTIQPPNGNAIGINLKTVVGDTGTKLHPAIGAPLLGLDPTVTSIYLWAASTMTLATTVIFG